MTHTCHAIDCEVPVPPRMLMCGHHWRLVPKDVQRLVWRHYREGQCDDRRPSISWLLAAREAIAAVARKECRDVPNDLQGTMVLAGILVSDAYLEAMGASALATKTLTGVDDQGQPVEVVL